MHAIYLMKWWFTICIIITAGILLNYFGLWKLLWEIDTTRLSFTILVLFTIVTIYIGIKLFQHSRGNLFVIPDMIWFLSGAMTKLGLIGTVIGFMFMLIGPFASIDVGNIEQSKDAIAAIASGMGVALTTTLVGLVCQLLTEFQLNWIIDEQYDKGP